jgi:hypothetical protein
MLCIIDGTANFLPASTLLIYHPTIKLNLWKTVVVDMGILKEVSRHPFLKGK